MLSQKKEGNKELMYNKISSNFIPQCKLIFVFNHFCVMTDYV